VESSSTWQPKILAFLCNWCSYAGADLVIRVMCSGRIDPQFILDAFAKGADGVLIGGCHPGDCHYQEGNYKTYRRVQVLKHMLRDLGIEEDRFRLEWISAAEGDRVRSVVNDMVQKVRALGPLKIQVPQETFSEEVPA